MELSCQLPTTPLALSPGSPIFSTHAKKEEEPEIQCQVCDVGPYTCICTRVGMVVDHEIARGRVRFLALWFNTSETEGYTDYQRV